ERAPRLEAALDDLGERRTRHEHALVDEKLEAREPCLVDQIGERLALADATLGDGNGTRGELDRRRLAPLNFEPLLQMPEEQERLVASVVRTVAEEDRMRIEVLGERSDPCVAIAGAAQTCFQVFRRHAARIITLVR